MESHDPATGLFASEHPLSTTAQTPLSGYSTIGMVFPRTTAATWKISADWMEPGSFIEMRSPRERHD